MSFPLCLFPSFSPPMYLPSVSSFCLVPLSLPLLLSTVFPYISLMSFLLCLSSLSLHVSLFSSVSSPPFPLSGLSSLTVPSVCSTLSLSFRFSCVSPLCLLPSVSSSLSLLLCLFLCLSSPLSLPFCLFPFVSSSLSLPLSLHLCLFPSFSYLCLFPSVCSPLSVPLCIFLSTFVCLSSYVSPLCLFPCVSLLPFLSPSSLPPSSNLPSLTCSPLSLSLLLSSFYVSTLCLVPLPLCLFPLFLPLCLFPSVSFPLTGPSVSSPPSLLSVSSPLFLIMKSHNHVLTYCTVHLTQDPCFSPCQASLGSRTRRIRAFFFCARCFRFFRSLFSSHFHARAKARKKCWRPPLVMSEF
jgi:hypothetical protein